MKRVLVLIFSTAGSAIGWWLGASFGVMTAFLTSVVVAGIGIWLGARVARNLGI